MRGERRGERGEGREARGRGLPSVCCCGYGAEGFPPRDSRSEPDSGARDQDPQLKIHLGEDVEQQLAFDLKKVQEQRQPTLDALKPQLDALKAAIAKSGAKRPQALNLLKHIYSSHPPKVEGAELKTGLDYENNSDMQRAVSDGCGV